MAGRIQAGFAPFGMVAVAASALVVGACETSTDVSATSSTARPTLTLDSGRTSGGVTQVTTRKAVKVIRGAVEPRRARVVIQRSRSGTGWFRGRRVKVRQGSFALRLRLRRGGNDFRLVTRVRGRKPVVTLLTVRRKVRPRPQPESTPVPTPEPPPKEEPATCDPNYEGACLDPRSPDYDCEGGSGNGPDYTGTVRVVGDDPFDLDADADADGDGVGCES
jgi:hypothetical protein